MRSPRPSSFHSGRTGRTRNDKTVKVLSLENLDFGIVLDLGFRVSYFLGAMISGVGVKTELAS
jgi:hypothetical protein